MHFPIPHISCIPNTKYQIKLDTVYTIYIYIYLYMYNIHCINTDGCGDNRQALYASKYKYKCKYKSLSSVDTKALPTIQFRSDDVSAIVMMMMMIMLRVLSIRQDGDERDDNVEGKAK